jgi:hypothetical protein
MPHQSNLLRFCHPNNTGRKIQVTELLITGILSLIKLSTTISVSEVSSILGVGGENVEASPWNVASLLHIWEVLGSKLENTWKLLFSELWCRADWYIITDISERHCAAILMVEGDMLNSAVVFSWQPPWRCDVPWNRTKPVPSESFPIHKSVDATYDMDQQANHCQT